MLDDAEIITPIPVTDLYRALEFYTKKLGLVHLPTTDDENQALLQTLDERKILLHKNEPAGADNAVAAFVVDDFNAVVQALRESGTHLLEFDTPTRRTANGIMVTPSGRRAWFDDPDGNVLVILELEVTDVHIFPSE
jgi:predicted enzyme related to lactoylglutathione lyase